MPKKPRNTCPHCGETITRSQAAQILSRAVSSVERQAKEASGRKGGLTTAKRMTTEQRRERAQNAARSRWKCAPNATPVAETTHQTNIERKPPNKPNSLASAFQGLADTASEDDSADTTTT